MITVYNKTLRDKELRQLENAKAGCWLHALQPSDAELTQLVSEYGLDEGLLRDALDPDEMPRLEVEDDVVYLITRFAYANGQQILTAPILIAVGPSFTLTLSTVTLPTLRNFLDNRIQFATTQKAKFLLQLLTQITGTYSGFLSIINRQIRSTRTGLHIERITNNDLILFVNLEEVLNDFLSELIPTNAILTGLLHSKKNLVFYEEDKDLIGDLKLNNEQSIEASKSNLKTIVNIREAYSTIMTNNLNSKVGALAALTIILTVPTFVASLFGMNVPLPLPEDSTVSFWIISGAIALITTVLLYLLRRTRWI